MAIVGLVTALATIQILLEQGYRMEVFRQFVHAKRRQRGAESVRRNAMGDEVKRLGGEEEAGLTRFTQGPVRRFVIERAHAVTTWLLVMVLFGLVDMFTLVAAVLELAGAWDPFSAGVAGSLLAGRPD